MTRTWQFVPEQRFAVEPELPHAPVFGLVPNRFGHPTRVSLDLRGMSRPAIALPPPPQNEPVKDYAPGSPERSELQKRLDEMKSQPLEIPSIIGGEEVKTGTTFDAVMPHDKNHVLAKVHKVGAGEIEKAVDASAKAWEDWHRLPWEDRAAVFLRAAELLSGPWR